MINPTLSWLSKVFKIDFHYIASGGFYLTLTQVTSAFIGLGMTVAFANLIPPETYGTYRYLLSLYALFAIGTLPGIDTAVVQSTIHNFEGSLFQGFHLKLKYGVISLIAACIYGTYIYIQGNAELAYLLFMMAFALPIMEAGTVVTAFFNGKMLYKEWAHMDITTQIVSAVSLITTMFFSDNILLLSLSYFIPYIALRTYTLFFLLPKHQSNNNEDPGLLSYGKHMSGFQIVTRIIGSIDQIALFHFLGPAQVAIFALAQAIPMRIQSLLKVSGLLALPKFADKSHREAAQLLKHKMLLFGVVIFFGCVIFVFIAPFIFTYLLPKYLSSVKYSQALVFYTLSAITYPFASLLSAHKKIKENYIVSVVSFIAKVGAVLFLVPIFGIWGAVWGVLISAWSGTAISIILLLRAAR